MTRRMLGLAAGVGAGAAFGILMLDRHARHRVAKKMRKTARAVLRKQAAWRGAALGALNRSGKEINYVLHKGMRVYHRLAS